MFLVMLLAVACVFTCPALADTTWVAGGRISGNLTVEGSPYMIQGNDTIGVTDTLQIGPGVTVHFTGQQKIVVNGLLRALGTAQDSIRFTTDTLDNPNRWRSLRFISSHDSCKLEYCIIEFSKAAGAGDDRYGGGIECRTSRPTISHCTIRHNYAQIDGGGIYCQVNSAPRISSCALYGNHAEFGGGGGLMARTSAPVLTNCSIHHNSTPLHGGGLSFRNIALPVITGCDIHHNTAQIGGGVYCTGATNIATLTACTIHDNTASVSGGGMTIASGPSQLSRCFIYANSAEFGGGVCDSTTGSILRNCMFTDNVAGQYGGGLYSGNNAATQILHCTFAGNGAAQGGNVEFFYSAGSLENSVIAFSSAGPGLTILMDSPITVSHNDFFWNIGGNITGSYPIEIGVEDTVNLNGDPCDVYNNIFLDPLFVDLANGNLHLQNSSPCISAAEASDVTEDFDGNPRPNPDDTQPDMGAFESVQGGNLYACGALSGEIGPGDVDVPCDIFVETGDSLVIAPGTRFHFLGRFSFTIYGKLEAIGAPGDSIIFTSDSEDPATDWRGLRFIGAHDSTRLSYVVVEHARGNGSSQMDGSGGVYCDNASFRMEHSTIRNNMSTHRGGGLACYGNSQPQFHECAILNNTAEGDIFIFGGGVFADHAAPYLNGCEIAFNSASHRGGGVYADSADIQLTNCLIHNNSAPDGAGLYAFGGAPALLRCTIQNNTATTSGGGAFLHSHANFSSCTIRNNTAVNGAGIYTDFFDAALNYCVLNSNNASGSGGAIYARTSAPMITRCTMVANAAATGAGIYLFSAAPVINSSIITQSAAGIYFESSVTAVVWYCDFASNPGGNFAFFNNDPAQGPVALGSLDRVNVNGDSSDAYFNIFLNPLFVDAPQQDFHLQEGSPCIQAGDPAQPLDPDGTIADIGAFFVGGQISPPAPFDLLSPANNDTVMADEIQFCWQRAVDPDAGDIVTYRVLFQTIDTAFTYGVGTDTCVTIPGGILPVPDTMFAAWRVEAHALYPDTTFLSTSLWYFYWFPAPDTVAVGDEFIPHPSSLILSAFPNPFNAQTTIRFDLPIRSHVTLDVFDVLGRRVAELTEGMREAGTHQVTFDASALSSGIYFVRMIAGEMVVRQKVLLLK